LALKFIQNASELGYSPQEIKKTLARHLDKKLPKEILVIETDKELREILIEEIRQTTGAKTLGMSLEDFKTNFENLESVFVALSDEQEKIGAFLPNDRNCVYLNAQSVPAAMSGETRPSEESLIAIASGWRTFLMMAKTILVAAKVDNDSIIVRSTTDENWQRGLDNAVMIICDSLTANKFPNDKRIRPFPLIADESLNELAGIIQNRRQ
jgi:DNA-binding transcriptional MerR regulator